MNKTARAELSARFRRDKAAGLTDLKFFFSKVQEATVEDVCAEVLHVYKEFDKGNVSVVRKWGDSRRPSSKS